MKTGLYVELCSPLIISCSLSPQKRIDEEKRLKKKEKEKEKRDRLKAEGKFLTAQQKADKKRALQMLEMMKAQGQSGLSLKMGLIWQSLSPFPHTTNLQQMTLKTSLNDGIITGGKI